ncbi:ABC transporter permease [Mesorhizobium sp. 1B3]|uniref:ABC transporter permease n=1 Tax=Mesorhizobium sp. 1B3 TaxID=3243599 RepID=UPI003D956642
MDFDFSLGHGAEITVNYILDNFTPALDAIAAAIGLVTGSIQGLLVGIPPVAGIALLTLLSLWRVGWRFGVFALISLALVNHMGLWQGTMETLSLVLSATIIAVAFGIPAGIAMARSERTASLFRPVLDLMQTMPAFVYLIPAAMFFGLGAVPGTIATVIFAMPPVVRLTNLGIRQVHSEFVEAGLAFGCTPSQLLFKVQLPNAMASIMAGVNQTIMLSLSMVVVASMIGAGGLGNHVLTGIQRLDVGAGFEGGLAVVILAVVLDRITQSFGKGSSGFLNFLAHRKAGGRSQASASADVATDNGSRSAAA